jgi:hypothetical protein
MSWKEARCRDRTTRLWRNVSLAAGDKDEALYLPYSISLAVTDNLSLHAKWIPDAAKYHTVTFEIRLLAVAEAASPPNS